MRTLAIELSGMTGTVAAVEQAAGSAEICLLLQKETPEGQRSARSLMPTLRDLMRDVDWQFDSIDLIAVTDGPGSFTSLRIGVTAAKLLAWSCDAEVVGINTLRAIAMRASGGLLHAVLDAQRQQLFAASFEVSRDDSVEDDSVKDDAVEIDATRIVDRDEWIASLPAKAVVAGDGLRKIQDQLADRRPDVVIAEQGNWRPSADDVAKLAMHDLRQGKAGDKFALLPNYFRKSAAEEKLAGG